VRVSACQRGARRRGACPCREGRRLDGQQRRPLRAVAAPAAVVVVVLAAGLGLGLFRVRARARARVRVRVRARARARVRVRVNHVLIVGRLPLSRLLLALPLGMPLCTLMSSELLAYQDLPLAQRQLNLQRGRPYASAMIPWCGGERW